MTALKNPFPVCLLALSSPSVSTLSLIRALFTKKMQQETARIRQERKQRLLAFVLRSEKLVECLHHCKCLLNKHVFHFQCEFLLLTVLCHKCKVLLQGSAL